MDTSFEIMQADEQDARCAEEYAAFLFDIAALHLRETPDAILYTKCLVVADLSKEERDKLLGVGREQKKASHIAFIDPLRHENGDTPQFVSHETGIKGIHFIVPPNSVAERGLNTLRQVAASNNNITGFMILPMENWTPGSKRRVAILVPGSLAAIVQEGTPTIQ